MLIQMLGDDLYRFKENGKWFYVNALLANAYQKIDKLKHFQFQEIEKFLKSYKFEEAEETYKQNQQYISKDDFNNLKIIYIRQQIIEKIEELLRLYKFEEAEKIYKQNQQYISKQDFTSSKIHYINQYTKETTDKIEGFLKSYQFEQAEKIYKLSQPYISEQDFTNLKTHYIEQCIEISLQSYQFEEAEKIYIKNQQDISKYYFTYLKILYIKKQINEEIEELLKLYKFEEAEKIYKLSQQYISKQDFTNLKTPYIKQYTRGITDKIEGFLKSYQFEEAEKIYKLSQPYISEQDFTNLKAPYIKQYTKGITDKTEGFLKSYQFEEAEEIYKLSQQYISEQDFTNLKIIYTKNKINEEIEELLKLYKFEESETIYKRNQQYISEQDFTNLKTHYINQYTKRIKDRIERLLQFYQFEEAEKIYIKHQQYISKDDFNNLKIIYTKNQLNELLALYDFKQADKIYQQNKEYISKNDFNNLKIIYIKKELNDQIEKFLKSYSFEKADETYKQNQQYIPEQDFKNLKAPYIKKYTKEITDKIEGFLQSYKFEQADELYKQNQQYISEEDFQNLKTPYIEQYTEEITEKIEGFLKASEFEQAEKLYEQNKMYISEKEYISFKSSYEIRKQIQDYLEFCQFEEAEKLYQENGNYITSEFHADIKNLIKQKIPELFSKNGLLFTNALLKQQSILSSEEYNPILDKQIKAFFNQNLKNIPINQEQLEAIRELDTNVLLKARAGSGKTSVATLKTFFLIVNEKIHPDHILMLAFNKKAANEIENRIRKQYGIIDYHNARTFHGLAYQLVQPKEALLFDEGDQNVSTQKQSNMIQRIINESMNPVFKANMYNFFKQEMKQLENIGEFLSKEDYYLYRRNYKYVTLRGDNVKSTGEKYIGDFLFEHGIKHRYEHIWLWDKKGIYRPDFSLFLNSKIADMVIEFWGIDENDSSKSVPNHWTTTWLDYKEEMERKRNFWRNRPNIAFIELSVADLSYATREDFEQRLAHKLMQKGVNLQKLTDEEIYNRLMIIYRTRLTGMFLQFIQKAKKQRLTPDDLISKINGIDSKKERVKVFSETANAVYRRYIEELKKTNSIDYDDLMERAINIVHESKGSCSIRISNDRQLKLNDLKYLFIDEYQDFSLLFYQLIDAIRQYNPNLKLFCVGDDWQAINAFAGSNLKFFNNFNFYISPAKDKSLLTNFRSASNLVSLANRFMEGKGEKSIAHFDRTGKIYKCFVDEIFIEQRPQMENSNEKIFDERFITYIDKNGSMVQVDRGLTVGRMLKACHSIITNPENIGKTVGILSRNRNLDFYYDNLSKIKQKLKDTCKDDDNVYRNFDKNIRIGTTHSFKGLEADIIIMLNVNSGQYPTIHPDNELYEIFGQTPADVLAEEQRLFYVGITRAKEALYILCERENESDYLKQFNIYDEYKVNYQYDNDNKIMYSFSLQQYSVQNTSKPKYNFEERQKMSKNELLSGFYGKR